MAHAWLMRSRKPGTPTDRRPGSDPQSAHSECAIPDRGDDTPMGEESQPEARRAERLARLRRSDAVVHAVAPELRLLAGRRGARRPQGRRRRGRPPRRDGRPLRTQPQLRRPGDRRLAEADRLPVRHPPDDVRPGPLPRRLRQGGLRRDHLPDRGGARPRAAGASDQGGGLPRVDRPQPADAAGGDRAVIWTSSTPSWS